MKNAILIIFIFLSTQAFSQEVNCKKYRTGIFTMTDKEIGTTIITRTKNKQIEENKKLGTKRAFDLVWVDDCTYELRNKKTLKGSPSEYDNPQKVLKVKITGVKDNKLMLHISANFTDFEMDAEMEIVK